jgi:membrane protein implicated in regulation of membrane protease activity
MLEHTLTLIVIFAENPAGRAGSDLRRRSTVRAAKKAGQGGERRRRGFDWLMEARGAMWKLPVGVALAALMAGASILALLVGLVIRSRRTGAATGASGMIGLRGKALTEVAPEGRVRVQGELWWARSRMKIAAGESVRVTGLDGLTLEVEAFSDGAVIPRPVSVIEERGLQDT